jgi:hypothetical protein
MRVQLVEPILQRTGNELAPVALEVAIDVVRVVLVIEEGSIGEGRSTPSLKASSAPASRPSGFGGQRSARRSDPARKRRPPDRRFDRIRPITISAVTAPIPCISASGSGTWIARPRHPPTEIALALPAIPSTEFGGAI